MSLPAAALMQRGSESGTPSCTITKLDIPLHPYLKGLADSQNTMRATSSLQSALRTSARVQPRMMLGARSYASGGAQNVPTTGQGSSQPAKGPEVSTTTLLSSSLC